MTRPLPVTYLATCLLATIDENTRAHSERVAVAAERFGRHLELPENDVQTLRLAGLLHDIGKRYVPLAILDKHSALNLVEQAKMQEHAQNGAQLLERFPALRCIVSTVLHHHEHVDGSGYPDAIAGDTIPLHARIIAIVDAYDAMTNERAYSAAVEPAEARAALYCGAGTHFDWDLVERFLCMLSSTELELQEAQTKPGLCPHCHTAQLVRHVRPADEPSYLWCDCCNWWAPSLT